MTASPYTIFSPYLIILNNRNLPYAWHDKMYKKFLLPSEDYNLLVEARFTSTRFLNFDLIKTQGQCKIVYNCGLSLGFSLSRPEART